jgi:catechol 2,3-dioxygenase-like lactoylglutathione lyase family enzyme
MIRIASLDHLVLTVADIVRTTDFYVRVLGMTPQRFESGGTDRHAVAFGSQKFNLHQRDHVVDPNVRHATPGSADVCLLTQTPIDEVIGHLEACGVSIIEGPVSRTGAVSRLTSVYFYDPDENLIEVAEVINAHNDEARR